MLDPNLGECDITLTSESKLFFAAKDFNPSELLAVEFVDVIATLLASDAKLPLAPKLSKLEELEFEFVAEFDKQCNNYQHSHLITVFVFTFLRPNHQHLLSLSTSFSCDLAATIHNFSTSTI